MKEIETIHAAGHVLCHDITEIVKGQKKGPAFRKGHIVTEEDIPVLLRLGKDHLFVWEKKEGILHENEAARILYEICRGEGMRGSDVSEGKIELIADRDGLFKVNRQGLYAVNRLGEMMIACRHGDLPVKKGDRLAGTRIIPLVIEQEKMDKARQAAGPSPLFQILPFQEKKVGIVTTGNEVFYGRIQDTFGPVIREKLAEYPAQVLGQTYTDDQKDHIREAILDFARQGAQVILCTGGMSVDPDDRTPGAIADTGAEIISYGAPVLPGAMLLVAYLDWEGKRIPVLGLPGCVMYSKRTIFDLVLPRVMADDPVTAGELAALGEGGFCLNCPVCTFPNCGFGKGRR